MIPHGQLLVCVLHHFIALLFRVCVIDIFSTSSTWSAVEDPELAQLIPTIVIRGKAPATVRKYSGAFLCWKNWASLE